jgi:enterochelin esterase-like enzyme
MSLTGTPFQVLLAVIAFAALAGTVRLMPRMRRAPSRTGLLLAGQLCTLVALLAYVNAHFDFYHSWGDLTGEGGAPEVPATAAARITGAAPVGFPPSVFPMHDDFLAGQKPPPGQGAYQSVLIRGLRSGITTPAYVYLPPQYAAEPGRRFPVLVAMTGYPGNAKNLITQIRIPQTAGAAIAAGRIQPMIIVMLRPMLTPPRDTECTDVPGEKGPQADTFFGQDLPAAIASAYRTAPAPAGWGLLGDSTGGYCSAKIAMRHSDRFSAAVSLSGYLNSVKDLTTGDLYGKSAKVRAGNDLIWRLRHLPPPPVSMLLTTAKVGERNYKPVRQFAALARAPLRVDTMVLPTGGHHFSIWRAELPGSLGWLSRTLRP